MILNLVAVARVNVSVGYGHHKAYANGVPVYVIQYMIRVEVRHLPFL